MHDSGEPTTGYTVHAGSSLRKLYTFIIVRDVATAAQPAVTPPSRGSCRVTAPPSEPALKQFCMFKPLLGSYLIVGLTNQPFSITVNPVGSPGCRSLPQPPRGETGDICTVPPMAA